MTMLIRPNQKGIAKMPRIHTEIGVSYGRLSHNRILTPASHQEAIPVTNHQPITMSCAEDQRKSDESISLPRTMRIRIATNTFSTTRADCFRYLFISIPPLRDGDADSERTGSRAKLQFRERQSDREMLANQRNTHPQNSR